MDFEKIVLAKLDKIENKQELHSGRLDVYNSQLEEHMSRTEQLENRIIPIEDHMKFLMKLTRLAVIVFAGLSSLAAVIGLFLKK
jgi:hypothetical protein